MYDFSEFFQFLNPTIIITSDHVGAYISYLAHSMTFVAGYSFLLTISSKGSRSLFLSGSCSCYLLGVASAVSLIVG